MKYRRDKRERERGGEPPSWTHGQKGVRMQITSLVYTVPLKVLVHSDTLHNTNKLHILLFSHITRLKRLGRIAAQGIKMCSVELY